MGKMIRVVLGMMVLLAGGAPLRAQDSALDWSESMRRGQVLEVKTVVGDVRVAFEVQLPAGVEFVGASVTGDLDFHTVSGDVRLRRRLLGITLANSTRGRRTGRLGGALCKNLRLPRPVQ